MISISISISNRFERPTKWACSSISPTSFNCFSFCVCVCASIAACDNSFNLFLISSFLMVMRSDWVFSWFAIDWFRFRFFFFEIEFPWVFPFCIFFCVFFGVLSSNCYRVFLQSFFLLNFFLFIWLVWDFEFELLPSFFTEFFYLIVFLVGLGFWVRVVTEFFLPSFFT